MGFRFLAASFSVAALASGQDQPKYQIDFPAEELAARRAFVLDFIGDEAFAIVQGAAQTPGFVVFRQSNELYYEERLYVRMEDVVVVTETGVENFTDFLPNEIEEIEALMKGDGILQMRPAESLNMDRRPK